MRFKTIATLNPGDKVCNDIFDNNGLIVVGEGVELTSTIISRLKYLGFPGAYVDDEISKGIELEYIIPAELRTAAKKSIVEGDIEKAIQLARDIVTSILEHGMPTFDMAELRNFDNYTYTHSVDVAVLCCVMGLAMELSKEELDKLVIAALLHDVGKYKISPHIINKIEPLTKDEFQILKQHSVYSFEIVSQNESIDSDIKNAILMHHENIDGSGYPMGLTGRQIPLLPKIIHVVDVYHALISERTYKPGYSTKEAAEYLMGGCGILFDKDVVQTFVRTIPLYAVGSEVELSDGTRAIVMKNRGINNLRPVIKRIDTSEIIDLAEPEYNSLTVSSRKISGADLARKEKSRSRLIKSTEVKKILIVDDMKPNIAMLRGILEDDYSIEAVTSGVEAIAAVSENVSGYDLILMDIDMPEMLGTEAAALINDVTGGQLPILFVSVISDLNTVITCKKLHAAGYVLRPYQPVYLQAEIERVLFDTQIY